MEENQEESRFLRKRKNQWIEDLEDVIKIVTPLIVLSIGLFGLFTDKLSPEDSHMLITAGGLATGLSVKAR